MAAMGTHCPESSSAYSDLSVFFGVTMLAVATFLDSSHLISRLATPFEPGMSNESADEIVTLSRKLKSSSGFLICERKGGGSHHVVVVAVVICGLDIYATDFNPTRLSYIDTVCVALWQSNPLDVFQVRFDFKDEQYHPR